MASLGTQYMATLETLYNLCKNERKGKKLLGITKVKNLVQKLEKKFLDS